ncbi:putative fructose-bisphosphate aldolase 2 [Hibiscus syriacus]|uniref:Fructose-bisphosphate aldolase n=1 Tax=Hibiscus syriacus TaxID=106335 RepID=A0A6A3A626_HIBSY|nr:putative fructose-bisphosphate aldolase 2 [Hibiscus syriacus]
MASISLPIIDKSEWIKGQNLRQPSVCVVRCHPTSAVLTICASSYADELKTTASSGRGILAMDESNATWLDGLSSCTAAYYQQGARFAKWRIIVSIQNGPSALAVQEAAWGLARYAAISQVNKLRLICYHLTFEVAQRVLAEVFFYLTENNVMFEGILLKPSMVTPGAGCKDKATPQQVADYTLKLLHRRIPPVVHGTFFYTKTFYPKLERNEPISKRMARLVLVCQGSPEHLFEEMGEADLRTFRQLRMNSSVPRPTRLLSSANTPARENQKKPIKECSLRTTSTKLLQIKLQLR